MIQSSRDCSLAHPARGFVYAYVAVQEHACVTSSLAIRFSDRVQECNAGCLALGIIPPELPLVHMLVTPCQVQLFYLRENNGFTHRCGSSRIRHSGRLPAKRLSHSAAIVTGCTVPVKAVTVMQVVFRNPVLVYMFCHVDHNFQRHKYREKARTSICVKL